MSQVLAGCCCAKCSSTTLGACVQGCDCEQLTECDCNERGGIWYAQTACPNHPGGRCCAPDGSCTTTRCEEECASLGGTFTAGLDCSTPCVNDCRGPHAPDCDGLPRLFTVQVWAIAEKTVIVTVPDDPCLNGSFREVQCKAMAVYGPGGGFNSPTCDVAHQGQQGQGPAYQVYDAQNNATVDLYCGSTVVLTPSADTTEIWQVYCQKVCVQGECCRDFSVFSPVYFPDSGILSGFCWEGEFAGTGRFICGLSGVVFAPTAPKPACCYP